MPVTPEDLLQAAVTLGGGNGEVDRRNAVSRGCYAAYHRCLTVAQGNTGSLSHRQPACTRDSSRRLRTV